MIQKTQLYISADKLKKISFDCPHCHAEILLDAENLSHKTFLKSKEVVCPICRENIEGLSTIFELLDSYVFRIKDYKQKIYFVFDAPENSSG